jgi:hypothetical protein
MLLPLVEVVGPEGEMVAARLGMHGVFETPDQVQFLKVAALKPSAGEVKRRPLHWLQLECFAVKPAAFLHVGDMKRDVIQFIMCHG